MSLTMSATFTNSAQAASAMRLLRQAGIGVQRLGRPAPVASPAQPLDPVPAAENAVPVAHAIPYRSTASGAAAPARCHLAVTAEPDELDAARAIIFRCGGVLH